MNGRRCFLFGCAAAAALLMAAPDTAFAYGGPGSIVSGVGAFFAVLAAIIASLFGFVWFPVKRLFRWMRGDARRNKAGHGHEAPADTPDT